jgi:hypothetical protein
LAPDRSPGAKPGGSGSLGVPFVWGRVTIRRVVETLILERLRPQFERATEYFAGVATPDTTPDWVFSGVFLSNNGPGDSVKIIGIYRGFRRFSRIADI